MTGRGRRPTFIPLPTARRVMRMGTYGAHQADGSSAQPGRGRLPPRGGVFSGQRAKEGGGVTCSHIDLTPYLVGDIYSVSAIVGGRRVPRRRRPRCVREYSSRSRYSEHRRDGLDEVDLTARINPLGRPAAHRTLSLSRRVARCVGSADRRSIHHVDASESTAFGMTTPAPRRSTKHTARVAPAIATQLRQQHEPRVSRKRDSLHTHRSSIRNDISRSLFADGRSHHVALAP